MVLVPKSFCKNLRIFYSKTPGKFEWKLPVGHDTGIKIYNRQSGKKVPLIINKYFAKWYICGPTVYDVAHVGHASSYVRFDIIRRILENYFNVRVVTALGITDVDDKIIKRANELNTSYDLVARKYEIEFFDNLKELNVLPPTFALRVSEHIPEIINFISQIINRGHAYVTDDGSVYFNVNESMNYGKLVKVPDGYKSAKGNKKCSTDFALWKACKPGEPHWLSPWGKGRPGWHIECSAMSSKIFGSTLDLHSGGIDLLFPHHENEEIQSCSYHGCDQWVNYWFHTGSLLVDDQKMSKSLKNFTSISELLKSYNSDAFRMFCFISQYRKELHYKTDSMNLPIAACGTISRFLADSNAYIKGNWSGGNISEPILLQKLEETSNKVHQNLMDDFDTASCFIDLMELIKCTSQMLLESNETIGTSPYAIAAVSQYILGIFKLFGFQFDTAVQETVSNKKFDFLLESALNFRNKVRENALACSNTSEKNNILQACDSFRDDLKSIGANIRDQKKVFNQ